MTSMRKIIGLIFNLQTEQPGYVVQHGETVECPFAQ